MKKVLEANNRKVICYMKISVCQQLESQAMSSELKSSRHKGSAQSPAYRMRINCIVTDSEKNLVKLGV